MQYGNCFNVKVYDFFCALASESRILADNPLFRGKFESGFCGGILAECQRLFDVKLSRVFLTELPWCTFSVGVFPYFY